MADPLITDTAIYSFGLFFLFFALVMLVIRYSNKELVKKFSNIYDKLKIAEKDLRHLAETEMHDKKEIRKEIAELRNEIEELKAAKHEKSKAILKATV